MELLERSLLPLRLGLDVDEDEDEVECFCLCEDELLITCGELESENVGCVDLFAAVTFGEL